jgi:Flp pilus assembly protein TadG
MNRKSWVVAKRPSRRCELRRGSVLAMTPAVIIVFCAISAFAVDMAYLELAKAKLEMAAESAALAGVVQVRNEATDTVVRANAVQFAELNEPDSGDILADADIALGIWDFNARSFSTTLVDPNAVQVTVRRNGGSTVAVPVFFARVFGANETSVSVSAVAAFTITTDENGVEEKGMPLVVQ